MYSSCKAACSNHGWRSWWSTLALEYWRYTIHYHNARPYLLISRRGNTNVSVVHYVVILYYYYSRNSLQLVREGQNNNVHPLEDPPLALCCLYGVYEIIQPRNPRDSEFLQRNDAGDWQSSRHGSRPPIKSQFLDNDRSSGDDRGKPRRVGAKRIINIINVVSNVTAILCRSSTK